MEMRLKRIAALALASFLMVSAFDAAVVTKAYSGKSQATGAPLQMRLEAKDAVVVGDPAKVNITLKNFGNSTFTNEHSSLGPNNFLWVEERMELN